MIEIREVTGIELYVKYPGQLSEQDCHVYLDCKRGVLSAEANPEIGNAVPMAVHHGHVQRWSIPALHEGPANELLALIAPLAERVVAGYSSEWDGNNHVAEFDADATAAINEIEALCDEMDEEHQGIVVWDAREWVADGDDDRARRDLGITATTTDADLERIKAECMASARDQEIDDLEGLGEYLEKLRDEAPRPPTFEDLESLKPGVYLATRLNAPTPRSCTHIRVRDDGWFEWCNAMGENLSARFTLAELMRDD